jgi:hypothetical protein
MNNLYKSLQINTSKPVFKFPSVLYRRYKKTVRGLIKAGPSQDKSALILNTMAAALLASVFLAALFDGGLSGDSFLLTEARTAVEIVIKTD